MASRKKTASIRVGNVRVGGGGPVVLIAGPCVIESRKGCVALAGRLAKLAAEEDIPLIFKASYDKANRSSHKSFRGPGMRAGLEILGEIRERFGVPVLTDVHGVDEVEEACAAVDVLQLPAFLCRQTDLVIALGKARKPVNVKKAQFMAPWDVENVVEKLESAGNREIMLTDRGTCFGYNQLVTDFRSLPLMRRTGYPVVYDATHSVQSPGGRGDSSGGDSSFVPCLARAAVAVGCDALFLETHVSPERALSDRDSMLKFSGLRKLWRSIRAIDAIVKQKG